MWYNKISGCPDPERNSSTSIITQPSHLVKSFFKKKKKKKCTNFRIKILKNLCIFSLDKMSQLCYNGRLGSRAAHASRYYNTFSATCQPLLKNFFIFVILHKNKIQHFAQILFSSFCIKKQKPKLYRLYHYSY